jgi:hypothetical protein
MKWSVDFLYKYGKDGTWYHTLVCEVGLRSKWNKMIVRSGPLPKYINLTVVTNLITLFLWILRDFFFKHILLYYQLTL